MSEENVELARQYYEAWNAGGLDGTRPLRHRDFEYIDQPDLPDPGRWVVEEADALRERMNFLAEIGWDGQVHDLEYLDAGQEVVVIWQLRASSPRGSGTPLEETVAQVCLFEDGKLRRIRNYTSREQALNAAGLQE
jgi:ketosteroid isomerase-like protein